MPTYRVVVKILAPYPMESEHMIKATKAWTAANTAMRQAYAALPANRRRRIDLYSISVQRLGAKI